MEVRSIYKYARISPFKAREVTREIQGLPVSVALDLLAFTPKKEAVVGEGPTLKRIMPRARGSASRILKRTSHIRIVLSDEIPIETRETRKAKRDQEKKAAKKETKNEASESAATVTDKKSVKPRQSAKRKK